MMTDTIRGGGPDPLTERSTAELVKLASEQISRLVRDELRLASRELADKGKHAGIGAGLFGGGGLLALYGVAGIFTTLVLVLGTYLMPYWAAAGVVTLLVFVIAGVLALLGRSQVKQATPAMPEQAVDNVKADIHTVTEAVKDGRRS
jgi:Flp pilus assembly protein TadB